MSTDTAVTMQDLELEHAELLPSRETLCACYGPPFELQRHQRGYGNTSQSG